jgi:16S rRNA (uracil1498-N3)-methyltransferase
LVAAAPKRFARWEKIVLESAQQSRRLRPPRLVSSLDGLPAHVNSPRGIAAPAQAFAQISGSCKILLSERREAQPVREVLRIAKGSLAPLETSAVALAIGPEGGWTDEELAAGRAAGFAEASLGESILRTETAVLASLAILQFVLGGS